MSPLRLTHTTALILQALASGSRHGFQIMEVTGLPSGTVYPVLRRLEREAAVASEWEDEGAAKEAGRRRRRIYRLNVAGQGLAELARQRLAETQRVLADGVLADGMLGGGAQGGSARGVPGSRGGSGAQGGPGARGSSAS